MKTDTVTVKFLETEEVVMDKFSIEIEWPVLVVLTAIFAICSVANGASQEMVDLNADMQEYLEASRLLSDPDDRFYISDMAVQNIYKQWAIWSSSPYRDESLSNLLGSSYTRFIVLHYHLNNPSWVEWGLIELETLLPSYKAYIDSTTELSYGEQLQYIHDEWLEKFATCNAFNELVPLKKLVDNPIDLQIRIGCYGDEDRYVLRTAELYLNRRLIEQKEYFYFYVPPGEYQISDARSYLFPKVFTANADSSQFVYLTPNYKFNFVPVAQVFSDTGVYYDTLSPSEFELIRLDEGRMFEFCDLEFGRYQFRVKPPYKIVDPYPNKLIIPKEEFGADYMQLRSELFDKDAYDDIIIANGADFVYPYVERVEQPSTPADDDKKRKKKKN
jgi:hypothetical protein